MLPSLVDGVCITLFPGRASGHPTPYVTFRHPNLVGSYQKSLSFTCQTNMQKGAVIAINAYSQQNDNSKGSRVYFQPQTCWKLEAE